MAFAKLGTTRGWTEIADDLGLPAALTNSIGAVLHRLQRDGRGP